ncbi:glycosyltransferase [Micromonospora sp. DT81.3]|uniref:glycosyltransferase n=1 Tax=Micromonospora sp. DT81.3 TaxID=3416523 RepID=UPI003CFA3117
MIVAVAATGAAAAAARETVRSIQAVAPELACHVLDVDGRYSPIGHETVSSPRDVGLPLAATRLTHDDADFLIAATALWATRLLDEEQSVLGLTPGILLVSPPTGAWLDGDATVAVTRTVAVQPAQAVQISVLANELFLLGTAARPHGPGLEALARDWRTVGRWLDLFLARVPHRVLADDALLVSRWNSDAATVLGDVGGSLSRNGVPVLALALDGLDPVHPTLFDSRRGASSGPLLSRNPLLAQLASEFAERQLSQLSGTAEPPADAAVVRACARAGVDAGTSLDAAEHDLETWLLELLPAAHRAPAARYLAGIRLLRSDLRDAFPHVPGSDSARLARWALDHGVGEPGYDVTLLQRAAERTLAAQPAPDPPDTGRPHGVNLVGYLSGELGVGTSARLMDAALTAAGVATSTFPVTTSLESRFSATYRHTSGTRYDTTLLAVNADQTQAVSEAMEDVVDGSYRIGMWYWEVESFPESRDAAFALVDEVWAATDFVRDAIAERAPIPVRTVTPPLPQRSAGDPPGVPAHLSIPLERAWFFFAFDYLSTVERKNPLGLVDAFTRAFPHTDAHGPVLVIKTLNAGLRLGEAERVRLAVAGRRDVIVIDEYLEPEELTALMARCTAYVSLHRAEGLGLTIAEAMAWGRPVVVTAYSGNMQFTNDRNAFLVPCEMTAIPPDADPYPAGTLWADPDLDQAAAILRGIVDDPDSAAAVGRRAEEDMRRLHSPEVVAQRVRESLRAGWDRRDKILAREARSARPPLLRRVRARIRRALFRADGRRR